MKKITREQFYRLVAELRTQALKNCRDYKVTTGDVNCTVSDFMSYSFGVNYYDPMVVNDFLEKTKLRHSRISRFPVHLITVPCLHADALEYTAVCVYHDATLIGAERFFKCEHPIGQCPHKLIKKKEEGDERK